MVQDLESRKPELDARVASARAEHEHTEYADDFKRNLVAVVAEELRGPITALELLVDSLQRDKESAPAAAQQQIIERMLAAVARLSAIIESLLPEDSLGKHIGLA